MIYHGDFMNRLVDKFSEFETKYEIEESFLDKFTSILEESNRHFEIERTSGVDDFYTRGLLWKRLRISGQNIELTTKRNIEIDNSITHRIETNLNLSLTDEEIIRKDLELDGYKYFFTLVKDSVVYTFVDASISFYKVFSKNHKKSRCFIEIEVHNNLVKLDEIKAWRIIKKYEKLLHSIGVEAGGRLSVSLYDIYKPDSVLLMAKSA